MSVRKTIAIDIDDVLADNAGGFVEFSNARWGTHLTPEQYDEHWAKIWEIDNQETERRATIFHESGAFTRYRHDDSALPVLRRLSQDFNLLVLTSRRTQTQGDTRLWLHEHYPGIFTDETIHFAGIWDTVNDQSIARTKGDLVEALGADYLIDDQLKHCQSVALNGKRALLFGNYAWNQTDLLPKGVVRVDDWLAVERYFYEG